MKPSREYLLGFFYLGKIWVNYLGRTTRFYSPKHIATYMALGNSREASYSYLVQSGTHQEEIL